ncbi:hypothetical protein X777_11297 [Ooceraea biroi]|uniref:Tyr recombinase domain-containing protein n=1 Tax=Ooceraea biroi TaxID=2015173 RepID=A0A026W3U9_OOCBI|nr:hypothetical protein X777_11297 [Ooceraea biroi]
MLLIAPSRQLCVENVQASVGLLEHLGFIINYNKSTVEPSQRAEFLGIIYDSTKMALELSEKKKQKMFSLLQEFTPGKVVSLRQWSSFVGFERLRYLELLKNDNNFDAKICLPERLTPELEWWKNHVGNSLNPIKQGAYKYEIFSDASTSGWGAFCDGGKARGFWTKNERRLHINRLELKAALFALKSFAKGSRNCEILLRLDNTTAVAYVNKMESFRKKGLPSSSLDIFEASLTESTHRQYAGPLKQWWSFCLDRSLDPYHPEEADVIQFLTSKFNEGAAYGTLNSIRSAISLISNNNIGQNRNISRFFKGIFMLRPAKPKYDRTWEVNIAFRKIEEWFPLHELSLDRLTKRLVFLLALCTAHRTQTLVAIKLSNIKRSSDGYEIEIPDRIKTSRPGVRQPLFVLPVFTDNPKLCIVSTIDAYIEATSKLRGEVDNLLITVKKPFKAASPATISRWIRTAMSRCSICERFTAHSTRHAATSAALKKGIDLETIRRTAGWSNNSQVFAKHYNKTIVSTKESFAKALML